MAGKCPLSSRQPKNPQHCLRSIHTCRRNRHRSNSTGTRHDGAIRLRCKTIFADVCRKSNIQPNKVEVTVEADKAPESPAVTGVTMKVIVASKARKELLEAAWRRTEANCPVLNIFKDPTPVKVEFESKTE